MDQASYGSGQMVPPPQDVMNTILKATVNKEASTPDQVISDNSLYTDISSNFYQSCGNSGHLSASQNNMPTINKDRLNYSLCSPTETGINQAKLMKICRDVIRDMSQHGLCVIDNFFQNLEVGQRSESVLDEVLSLYQIPNVFREGGLVNDRLRTLHSDPIRGDRITFVTGGENACSNIAFLIRTLDTIITICSNSTVSSVLSSCNIRSRTKAMVACYPGHGAQYVKHVDNPNRDGRAITCIYYLNKGWREEDGGVLRLYPQGKTMVANIAPFFDRLIFFWSDRRNPHEVHRSFSVRFAITVWYFNNEERQEALRRKEQEGSPMSNTDQELFPLPPFNSV